MNVNSSHNEKLEANFRRGEEEAEDAARVASRMEVVVAILIEVVVVLIKVIGIYILFQQYPGLQLSSF